MEKQKIILSTNLKERLKDAINSLSHDKIFILTDEITFQLCKPAIESYDYLSNALYITIGATDIHKTIEFLTHVWYELSNKGGSRNSLLINLGGGMVTDLGGFAASTFKRGIKYINIPTTLLSMIDASVGGKTGINFNGLKNEIGVFNPASCVLLDTNFLRTLDYTNICSGYADLLHFDLNDVDYSQLQKLVALSVKIKERFVKEDPYEQGIRKALNLGHTVGHAFESLALSQNKPILHGYAVAWGCICELYLSAIKVGFPHDKLYQTIQFIKEYYGDCPIITGTYTKDLLLDEI